VLSRFVRLELHGDVLFGWLLLQGQGFASNNGSNAFDPALGGGIRASIDRWSITPWLDVTLLGWFLHQSASASDSGMHVSTEIPRFDVWVRVGVAYGRRR
jgi:hypothetical protein